MSDLLDGAVDHEVSHWRDSEGLIMYDCRPSLICPIDGTGEVYAPMQTARPPRVYHCLRCGRVGTASEFREVGNDE